MLLLLLLLGVGFGLLSLVDAVGKEGAADQSETHSDEVKSKDWGRKVVWLKMEPRMLKVMK